MFTNKKEMTKENETSGAVNIIGIGTIITGDIQSKGDIRIDGTLKGAVKTSGKVVVGQAGIIEGDVEWITVTEEGELLSGESNNTNTFFKLDHLQAQI